MRGNIEKFCEEYIVDYDPEGAAIRAGYAKSGAKSYGKKLLQRKDVAERICKLQEKIIETESFESKNGHLDSKSRVLNEFWDIYRRSMQEKPVKVWDKDLKKYVETGEYQFDEKTAVKCLECIAKLGGMVSEKAEKEAEKNQKDGIFEIVLKVEKDEI